MLSRTSTRVLPAVLAATVVLLAGCGSSNSSDASSGSGSGSLDSVKVTGQVGKAGTMTFNGKVTDTSETTQVLVTGNGPVVHNGDSLFLHSIVADGSTEKTINNSYTTGKPDLVTLSNQVPALFLNAIEGKTIGSRVMVSGSASKLLGANATQAGLNANDDVLIVFDLVGKPLSGPNGAKHPAPKWAPKIIKTKGVVSGLNFKGTPKPDGKLHSATLQTGTGPVVTKGQTIVVHYLGQVYKAKKPFDQNFDSSPASFQIGAGAVIPGWDKTLVGQHVGSEVVLAIPPKDGYGKKGSPQAGIKGTDTLYFVVDILGAA